MNQVFSLQIDNEKIVFAELINRENLEVVAVCKSGNIFLFDVETENSLFLTKLSFNPYQLNLQMHSFENYVCITQKNGLQGMVIDLSNSKFQKNLSRIDYHAAHCLFPISFYKKQYQTFLIHGTEWNRLDITCLETDELLTSRIVDYETNSNYFDYFHSSLLVSPDEKHFTSNGWHWHPFGQIYNFSIDDFLKKFELSHQEINVAEEDFYDLDWDRPLCWIDAKTLAIGFNEQICDENQKMFSNEVLFFDITENKIFKRINFDGVVLSSEGNVVGELFYDDSNRHLIGLNKKSGALITNLDGKEIYRNENLITFKFSLKHKLFYKIDTKKQEIQITKINSV